MKFKIVWLGVIVVVAGLGLPSYGGIASHSQLNSPADLDLSGEIIYAINFGNNGSPYIDGVYFTQDQDQPEVITDAQLEATMDNFGPGPNTGYPQLDILLNGAAYTLGFTGTVEMRTSVSGLEVGHHYLLQIVGYMANHGGGGYIDPIVA